MAFKCSKNTFSLSKKGKADAHPFNPPSLKDKAQNFQILQTKKINQHKLVLPHLNSRCHDDISNPPGNPQMTPKTSETPDINVTFIWELMRLTDHGHCKVH